MTRHHNVQKLTTAELERAKRELQASLGLINPDSLRTCRSGHICRQSTPNVPVASRPAGTRTVTTKRPPGPPFPYCPAGREPEGAKPPARAGLDTARAGPETNAMGFRHLGVCGGVPGSGYGG